MQAHYLRHLVFLAVVVVVLVLIAAGAVLLIRNLNEIAANALWILAIIAFVLLVWKGDFLLMLKAYERAVITRFGKVARVGGPGWCVRIPGIESATVVDLRTETVDVPKQDVITKENIELKVEAILYLRVNKDKQSVINSVVEIDDYKEAARLYLISSIRAIIGTMTLPEVIARTEELETKLQQEVEKIASKWGIEVVSVDFKDVDIPDTVLQAMHEEKAAEQRKFARMESAEAHMAEIKAVRDAAEQLSDKALAYYYIRALEKIGRGKSTKFIFPMELSRLAEAVGGRVGGTSSSDLEQLFKKYAPAVTNLLSKNEKEKIQKEAKKR